MVTYQFQALRAETTGFMLGRGAGLDFFMMGKVKRRLMGQVVCIWCKTRSSVWRRRVFLYGLTDGVKLGSS